MRRYDLVKNLGEITCCEMLDHPRGNYVEYEDHEAVVTAIKEERNLYKKALYDLGLNCDGQECSACNDDESPICENCLKGFVNKLKAAIEQVASCYQKEL